MTTDYKAYVSSTAKDLLPHRAHVIQELRRAGEPSKQLNGNP